MTTLGKMMSETVNKFYAKKLVNFMLSLKLCKKCMDSYIKKNDITEEKSPNITQTLGVCNDCGKGGIVFYLEWK